MKRISMYFAALALVVCTAEVAAARCALFLDGDLQAVDEVRAELDAFEDDAAPCLAMHAVLVRDNGVIFVDLRDEHGRAAQRSFTSAAGAAAYLMSWARRPLLPNAIQLAAPAQSAPPVTVAPPPVTAAPRPAAGRASPWHPELALTYMRARSQPTPFGGDWATVAPSLMFGRGILRAGAGARGMLSVSYFGDEERPTAAVDLIGIVQVTGRVWRALALRGEISFGGGMLANLEDSEDRVFGSLLGARGAAAWPVSPGFALEVGGGFAIRRFHRWPGDWGTYFDEYEVKSWSADVGLRWSL